ncbi:MAG: hypothetical protein OXD50_04135 [Chloroflexi bacterium]|nr:hypothetical protein [Chloroflexota bacterium]
MRAPDIYHEFLDKAEQTGRTLQDYATGERYLNTGGADGFFVLSDVAMIDENLASVVSRSKEGQAAGFPTFKIERRFLRPGWRRTDHPRLQIDSPDCHVLAIPPDTDISRFEVRDYIRWGEEAGFHKRSVPKSQSPWWRPPLQAQSGATILWLRTHADSHRCYFNPNRFVSLRFFRLHPNQEDLGLPLLALLNSSVFALLKEIHGRRGLGQGALETGLMDIMPLPVPKLESSVNDRLIAAVSPILNRDVEKIRDERQLDDRHLLDSVVLEAYGLPVSVLTELYDELDSLIDMRHEKARNID